MSETNPPSQSGSGEADAGGGRSQERLNLWKGVFDFIYRKGSDQDTAFNTSGYQSSYERKPISAEAMAESVATTVARIRELRPHRVLEIGCGTGLLLQRLAPDCQEYWGIDLSPEAIKLLQSLGLDPARVRLLTRPADQLHDLPRAHFDTVVVNSVIQYFPSVDYFVGIVEQALDHLQDRGAIFLGDVRHLGLLAPLQTEVAAFHANDDLPIAKLKQRIAVRLDEERELLFDPRFFTALKRELPTISHVESRLKNGHELNELTRYRYDVVLYVGDWPARAAVPTVSATEPGWEQQLETERPEALRIAGVANSRLEPAIETLNNLDRFSTVGALREWISQRPAPQGRTPQEWIDWCRACGYRATLCWTPGATDGSFDILLERQTDPRSVWDDAPLPPGSSRAEFVNDPLGDDDA